MRLYRPLASKQNSLEEGGENKTDTIIVDAGVPGMAYGI